MYVSNLSTGGWCTLLGVMRSTRGGTRHLTGGAPV